MKRETRIKLELCLLALALGAAVWAGTPTGDAQWFPGGVYLGLGKDGNSKPTTEFPNLSRYFRPLVVWGTSDLNGPLNANDDAGVTGNFSVGGSESISGDSGISGALSVGGAETVGGCITISTAGYSTTLCADAGGFPATAIPTSYAALNVGVLDAGTITFGASCTMTQSGNDIQIQCPAANAQIKWINGNFIPSTTMSLTGAGVLTTRSDIISSANLRLANGGAVSVDTAGQPLNLYCGTGSTVGIGSSAGNGFCTVNPAAPATLSCPGKGTFSTVNLSGQASQTGTRYLCINTSGDVLSSPTACSGT